MIEYVIYALVALVLCAIVFSQLARRRRTMRARGVRLVQALRMLLKHIQVHRGLVATYLGGEKEALKSIAAVAASVKNDINHLQALDESIFDNEDWQGITRHWAKLSVSASKQEIYNNYEQHCKLVSSCLAFMIQMAKAHNVNFVSRGNEKIFWLELLVLGEKLGQLRALGMMRLSGALDQKVLPKCLNKLRASIKEIEVIFQQQSLQKKLGAINSEEISNFIVLVEHYIIANSSWITTDRYFSVSTETIEIIYACFDKEMQRLLQSL